MQGALNRLRAAVYNTLTTDKARYKKFTEWNLEPDAIWGLLGKLRGCKVMSGSLKEYNLILELHEAGAIADFLAFEELDCTAKRHARGSVRVVKKGTQANIVLPPMKLVFRRTEPRKLLAVDVFFHFASVDGSQVQYEGPMEVMDPANTTMDFEAGWRLNCKKYALGVVKDVIDTCPIKVHTDFRETPGGEDRIALIELDSDDDD